MTDKGIVPETHVQKWDLLELTHRETTGDHVLSSPVDPEPEPVLGAGCPAQQFQIGFFAKRLALENMAVEEQQPRAADQGREKQGVVSSSLPPFQSSPGKLLRETNLTLTWRKQPMANSSAILDSQEYIYLQMVWQKITHRRPMSFGSCRWKLGEIPQSTPGHGAPMSMRESHSEVWL